MHPYRGRLAPSPTGYFHLGHARTFWIAYQRALKAGGTLVFRNEDLDRDRCKQQFVNAMYEDLVWLGIEWQEGPDVGGSFAPYSQSERREHYLNAWRTLRDRGAIYPCTCSRKDLVEMASAPHDDTDVGGANDDEPLYPGKCRPASGTVAAAESPAGMNWRFRVPDGEAIDFADFNLGEQRFVAGKDLGDFLIWRRDDFPSYQLACAVDDAAMRITEVVRGADLLKSTARQLLLFRALGLSAPQYFHCELMTDERGQRLAKRHDALSLRTLREQGVTPEEIICRMR
ncbi:MAG: tRNA glutamyl-Q(34) synthetase GluQRS [Terriglobales bacterium]